MQDYISNVAKIAKDMYSYGRNSDLNALRVAMGKFYLLAKESPSLAQIVCNDVFESSDRVYHNMMLGKSVVHKKEHERLLQLVRKNLNIVDCYKDVQAAKQFYIDSINEHYKHSEWIRDKIIEDGRISLSGQKNGKAGFLYKLKIAYHMKKHGIKSFFK